jgi:choline kinase
MKAIILAAGRGSRMGAMTAEQPKCLTVLDGRPLLHWQMSALRGAGIDDIGIVGGYKNELLAPYVRKLFVNARWAETNMVASLMCAAEWLRMSDCIISYSDIFYAPQTVKALTESPHDICMSYDVNWLELWSQRFSDPLSDAEQFKIDADGRVTAIGARAATAADIEGQYMGLLKFTPRGWAAIERFLSQVDPDRLDMTSLLSRLIAAGEKVYGVKSIGAWGEVDSEQDLRLYERLIANGQLRLAEKA